MAVCEVCGNDYQLSFEVIAAGHRHVFDSFECAIHKLAPICEHCGCRVIGHGIEGGGRFSAAQIAPATQGLHKHATTYKTGGPGTQKPGIPQRRSSFDSPCSRPLLIERSGDNARTYNVRVCCRALFLLQLPFGNGFRREYVIIRSPLPLEKSW